MASFFRTRSALPSFALLIITLITGFVVQRFQNPDPMVFEGTYPGIRGLITPSYVFGDNDILLRLDEPVSTRQLVVFVYSADGSQYGMFKDVRDGVIRITEDDFPEYQAVFADTKVEGYRIFRRVNGKADVEDFLSLMREAKASGLRFGVQQCIYPVCTRCLVACPLINRGVIEMRQAENGQILPFVYYGGCQRSGKCFAVCGVGAIYRVNMLHVQVNPENTVKLETVLEPRVLQ
jgi:formate hydrogenlyase subunit 6/NADH:ubiquinone oxidoreductase subunit I